MTTSHRAAVLDQFNAYIERRHKIRHLSDLAARAVSMPRGPALVIYQCTSGHCGRCHFCKWPQSVPVSFREQDGAHTRPSF